MGDSMLDFLDIIIWPLAVVVSCHFISRATITVNTAEVDVNKAYKHGWNDCAKHNGELDD